MEWGDQDKKSKWELNIGPVTTDCIITVHKGLRERADLSWRVSPPNMFERLLGITFEQKLEKTKIKAQKIIDKLNEDIVIINESQILKN